MWSTETILTWVGPSTRRRVNGARDCNRPCLVSQRMAYALTTMAADESLYEVLHELAFELERRHELILHPTVANEITPEKFGGQMGVNLPRTLPFNVVRGRLTDRKSTRLNSSHLGI